MAFERIGLGGILTFDGGQAVVAMGQASNALKGMNQKAAETPTVWGRMGAAVSSALTDMKAKAAQIGSGMGKIGGAVQGAAMAAAPITFGLTKAFNTAVGFEKQMSAVFSVINSDGSLSADTLTKIRDKAQEMGAESVYTSTEAGQAMEAMAKNGATADEIMTSLGAVMNAAAADGIGLAEAADVVSSVANGMRRPMSEAVSITDVLAKAASMSATSIRDLGESFKYGGTFAADLNMSVEETAAAFAAVSNNGLKGSIGGTAMTQMLEHMAKTTPKATALLEQLGLGFADTQGNILPLTTLIPKFDQVLSKKFKGTQERAAAVKTLFGTEGARAFGALVSSVRSKDKGRQLGSITKSLEDAQGTAAKQAEIRMDNFFGRWTQFMGAIESLSIEVFGLVSNNMKGALDSAAKVVGQITSAFMMVKVGKVTESVKKNGSVFTQVALGLYDAIVMVNEAWNSMIKGITDVGEAIGFSIGRSGVRDLTRFIALFIVAAGIGAPVMAGILALGFVVKSILIPAIAGILSIASAVFSPMGILIAGIIVLIYNARGQIMQFLDGLWVGFSTILPELGTMWTTMVDVIKFAFTDLFNFIFGESSNVQINWREVGMTIGVVIATAVATGVELFTYLVLGIEGVIKILYFLGETILGLVLAPLRMVWQLAQNIGAAFGSMFGGNIIDGIMRLHLALLDFVIAPFRMVFAQIVRGMEALGMKVGPGLRAFIEGGFTGLIDQTSNPTTKPAEEALDTAANQERKRSDKSNVNVKATIDDKRKLEIKNELKVDGRQMAVAHGKHTQEVNERAGFKVPPWQLRMSVEQGTGGSR